MAGKLEADPTPILGEVGSDDAPDYYTVEFAEIQAVAEKVGAQKKVTA